MLLTKHKIQTDPSPLNHCQIKSSPNPDISNQIEIHTKSGYKIIIGQTISGIDRILIEKNEIEERKSNSFDASSKDYNKQTADIEVIPSENYISVNTNKDLFIKAKNIQIQASEEMKLKSDSILTINGSIVKIN